jgi:DNA excision repair protein ERCC-2
MRNVIPAPHLHARFAAACSVVLFSATSEPGGFITPTCWACPKKHRLDRRAESPFSARAADMCTWSRDVSTRWMPIANGPWRPIAALIARQYAATTG